MAKDNSIEPLFDASLKQLQASSSLELDISQLQKISAEKHQHLAILFDLAFEELVDPSARDKYLTLEQLRRSDNADSSNLSKALERFERYVQKPFQRSPTPLPSNQSTSYRRPLARAARRIIPATPLLRLRAALLDLPWMALLSLIIFIAIIPLTTAGLFESIERLLANDEFGKILLSALFLKAALATVILRGLIAIPKKGLTFGLRRQNLRLVSEEGSLPRTSQLIVRALLAPFAMLTTPVAFLFGCKKGIEDVLSATVIIQH